MFNNEKISNLAKLLKEKKISSLDLCHSFIERVEALEPKINSFITFDKDLILKGAKESDDRRSKNKILSKYDGIPLSIKDNICTKGTRTTAASKILENFIPPYNATSYQKLLNLGFIPFGKTNLDEFAMGSSTETSFFGVTKNPYDPKKVPGGSSGGSAAAVAARLTPAALGSDTGGSIRQPAAFCGVVGIKPTYGRVSRYGLMAFASSLDQIGTFANNIDDAALTLAAISGHDPKDTTSINQTVDFSPENLTSDIKGLKIGIPEEYFSGVDPEIKESIQTKVNLLEKKGAIIKKISLKYNDYAIPIYYLIATAEASSNLARYDGVRYGYRSQKTTDLLSLYNETRSEGFAQEVKRRIILGTFVLSSGYYDAYYLQALKGRTLVIEDFKKAFSEVDAIITPVTPSTAFAIGERSDDPLQMYLSDILTISVNLAGIPALSIPIGLDKTKMPIGLQIMGNHFQEKTILNLAKAIEDTCEPLSPSL